MKRLLWILPLLLLLASCNNYRASRGPADWIYVATTGNDGTGDGSAGAPYATVSFACTQATAGDTIYVNPGTITESAQIVKPLGVSIIGAGQGITIINSTYVHASSVQAAMQCASTAGSTVDDNSTLSHFTFTGSNRTSQRGIYVGYRNNFIIHHVTLEDFNSSGIYFDASQTTYPDLFITGCEIHDNIINNCADRLTGYDGCIRIRGTDGVLIYNNIIDQTFRPTGTNGISIAAIRNKRMRIYSNTLYRNDHEITSEGVHYWNFFFEEHGYRGDCQYYNNTHYGLAKLSLGGDLNKVDDGCTYGFKLYNNQFLNAANGNRTYNGGTQSIYGINLEGNDHVNVEIYNNYLQRFGTGIELSTPTAGGTGYWQDGHRWQNISVHNNIIEKCGYADYNSGWGIQWLNETMIEPYYNLFSTILIANNTITGDNGGTYPARYGIGVYANGTVTGLNIQNNIVYGFSQYGIYISEHQDDGLVLTNCNVTYNIMNSNGTNTVYFEEAIEETNVDITTGNLTSDPLFRSASDLRLQSTSPAINAGTNVSLTSDFAGHRVPQNDTVDIGAYEYGDYLFRTPSGKLLRNANGKLMITH